MSAYVELCLGECVCLQRPVCVSGGPSPASHDCTPRYPPLSPSPTPLAPFSSLSAFPFPCTALYSFDQASSSRCKQTFALFDFKYSLAHTLHICSIIHKAKRASISTPDAELAAARVLPWKVHTPPTNLEEDKENCPNQVTASKNTPAARLLSYHALCPLLILFPPLHLSLSLLQSSSVPPPHFFLHVSPSSSLSP